MKRIWYASGTQMKRIWYAYETHLVRILYASGAHETHLVRILFASGTHVYVCLTICVPDAVYASGRHGELQLELADLH